jgi:predicted nuclease of predicted toxin-antitoxin system
MKFLVDMPLSPALAAWLRERGYDAVHAAELGFHRSSDADILAHARNETRTVVTVDLDYPRLLALARATNPAVILFRGGAWSDVDVAKRMGELLQSLTSATIEGSIIVVDRHRIRRRSLPVDPPLEPREEQ